jgi:hypothetical protein
VWVGCGWCGGGRFRPSGEWNSYVSARTDGAPGSHIVYLANEEHYDKRPRIDDRVAGTNSNGAK